ncbi:MAG: hypothetical protein EOO45_28500 [Flavobacterium sp.]|nr:MAG: hypothetical protein EOO45_28500 [Flavobacterium sp.]
MAIKLALDYAKERTNLIELEKENLQLEFNFLRSQVNPHFLFNTLNNIHSLIVQDRKEQASATVARLSGFLRHSLYESGKERMDLAKEIELLQDYIALEKVRLNKTSVHLETTTDGSPYALPPLLFMPLVENAFKYNADNLPTDSFINIYIEQEGKNLQFRIRNNYDAGKRGSGGGIGMQNLQKRLLHYYPGKHRLELRDEAGTYEVKISIDA